MTNPSEPNFKRVEIRFDNLAYNASFVSPESANAWILETLGALLRAYDIGPASKLEIRAYS
jgi:hypothetical protein